MWYMLWTNTGDEEKTRQMINDQVDNRFFYRCIVPYCGNREFFRGNSTFVEKPFSPTYVFIETNSISDFSNHMRQYPVRM